MKSENFLKSLLRCNILFITALLLNNFIYAQSSNENTSKDEQTIRNLVQQHDRNPNQLFPHTEQNIFVSGAFPKPILGGQQSEEDKQIREKMKTERLNYSINSRIDRLVFSKSMDMAYEFGYAILNWDTPEKKHISFESSYLRIWRNLNNEWKVDVSFARPNVSTHVEDK